MSGKDTTKEEKKVKLEQCGTYDLRTQKELEDLKGMREARRGYRGI